MMCEYCHHNRHLPGCPNYEPDDYGICKICGNPIEKDDEYIELPYEVVHLECLVERFDSDPHDALDMLGASCFKAGE